MAHQIELNPVSFLTVGTVGPPGQRVFYLQGSRRNETISLIVEKQQMAVLADSIESFLDELEEKHPAETRDSEESVMQDMRLREPVEGLYRVGNMGLGYNESEDQIVLVAYELVDEDEDPDVVSFWATRAQMVALIKHTRKVVAAGRPICGNCGRPMDPQGHFCPNRNGHRH
ncbi:MAG: DUF3090 family protein [Chloroflexi bacterium]|jgi:uncharacterized repeat protein (TIGR03847 family)|nr:DUF3090 family protein [Chloroflexota bacterium]